MPHGLHKCCVSLGIKARSYLVLLPRASARPSRIHACRREQLSGYEGGGSYHRGIAEIGVRLRSCRPQKMAKLQGWKDKSSRRNVRPTWQTPRRRRLKQVAALQSKGKAEPTGWLLCRQRPTTATAATTTTTTTTTAGTVAQQARRLPWSMARMMATLASTAAFQ